MFKKKIYRVIKYYELDWYKADKSDNDIDNNIKEIKDINDLMKELYNYRESWYGHKIKNLQEIVTIQIFKKNKLKYLIFITSINNFQGLDNFLNYLKAEFIVSFININKIILRDGIIL